MNKEKLINILGKLFWGTLQTLEAFFKFIILTTLVIGLSEVISYYEVLNNAFVFKFVMVLFILGGYYWTFKNPMIRFRNYFMRARE